MSNETIRCIVNGKDENIPADTSIKKYLDSLGVNPALVAVEINDNVVERKDFEKTIIQSNDRVEYLFFMGGGDD